MAWIICSITRWRGPELGPHLTTKRYLLTQGNLTPSTTWRSRLTMSRPGPGANCVGNWALGLLLHWLLVTKCVLMNCQNILIWNVRDLNARTTRDMVHNLVAQERVSLMTLQETKLDCCDQAWWLSWPGPTLISCICLLTIHVGVSCLPGIRIIGSCLALCCESSHSSPRSAPWLQMKPGGWRAFMALILKLTSWGFFKN